MARESELKRLRKIGKVAALVQQPGTPGERKAASAALQRMRATATDITWAEALATVNARKPLQHQAKAHDQPEPQAPEPPRARRRRANPGTGKRPVPLTKAEIAKRKREHRYHDGSKPLTVKGIAKLRGPARYHDGGPLSVGLYLQITATGARSWLLRFELHGKERAMGLGSAALFGLAEARERARAARRLVIDGVDPIASRAAAKAAAAAAAATQKTFAEAADLYFKKERSKWSVSHAQQFESSLKRFVLPIIGRLDVAVITRENVQSVLDPIWSSRTVTAGRLRSRIEAILDWAVFAKYRPDGPNPAKWQGNLEHVMTGGVRKLKPVVHFAALPFKVLPEFMARLARVEGVAAKLLQFIILTGSRRDEARCAVWSEIDLDAALWVIPASRMKAGREHRVPLTPACVALLKALPRETGNPFVFIGMRPGQCTNQQLLAPVLKRLGIAATVHGFRSTFSTWAYETTKHEPHAIEISLSHTVGSDVERAYRRGDHFQKRIDLMNDWAAHCYPAPADQDHGAPGMVVA